MLRGESVDITPGVSILSLFRHLNYRPWYALAEFVDNSLESFLTHQNDLQLVDGPGTKLVVRIGIESTESGRITIRDNAAGIDAGNYQRAFKTASPPVDRSGLSLFGVGMKSAACWFAGQWSVRTKALGEDVERFIELDVATIVREGTDRLAPTLTQSPPNSHFTEITLVGLHNRPQTKTIAKIRDHLASIFRTFIADGVLELWFNKEPLSFDTPRVLYASYYKEPTSESHAWQKDVDFDFGAGQRVHGFAAIRQVGSTSEAGFALFNKKRLVQGSKEEGYRPYQIFGRSNSYTYQRLFGELHLEGFAVAHTKDGFRLDQDEEEALLDILREYLDAEPLPLLKQAENYMVRTKPDDPDLRMGAEKALESTAEAIESRVAPILEDELRGRPHDAPPPDTLDIAAETSTRTIHVILNGVEWDIELELTRDPAVEPWVELADTVGTQAHAEGGIRRLQARLALQHPFMVQFAGTDREKIEPLLRVAAALMLAETVARESGVKMAGTIRLHLNAILRRALAEA